MQRYFIKEKKDNYLILDETDLHHIKNVMRNKVGDKIECIYQEKLYICQIEELSNSKIKIIEECMDDNEIMGDITIAIALVKEQKMDLILQKACELGVSKIIPVNTTRSIVKLDKKDTKKIERWNKILKEASEQSKRVVIPKVNEIMDIK